jgi:hypothetical protein
MYFPSTRKAFKALSISTVLLSRSIWFYKCGYNADIIFFKIFILLERLVLNLSNTSTQQNYTKYGVFGNKQQDKIEGRVSRISLMAVNRICRSKEKKRKWKFAVLYTIQTSQKYKDHIKRN